MSQDFDDLLRRGLARAADRHQPLPAAEAATVLLDRRAAAPRRRRTGFSVDRPRWQLASGGIVAGALVAAAVAGIFAVGTGGSDTGGSTHGVAAAARPPAPLNAAVGAAAGAQAAVPAAAPAGAGTPSRGSGSAGSAAFRASAAGTAAKAPPVELTAAGGGRTLSVTPGAIIQVDLSGDHLSWSRPRSGDPGIVEETSASARPAAGTARATFVARGPGSATITATGRPMCQSGRPCPQFIRLWTVTVHVSG